MLRFFLLALIITFACRLYFKRWPWEFLTMKSTRSQALFRARKLLGVSERANRKEIIEAHKRLVAIVHPDRGGTNDQVHEANAARDLLLDELPEHLPDERPDK